MVQARNEVDEMVAYLISEAQRKGKTRAGGYNNAFM